MSNFEAGRTAFIAGKTEQDNPFICGVTKLGATKFSDFDAGSDWHNGWLSAKPARVASKQELAGAAKVDVSRFRRKSNRYYSG